MNLCRYVTEQYDPGDTDVDTKFSIKFKDSMKQDEGQVNFIY